MTKTVIQGEDIVLMMAGKKLAHATTHTLNSNLALKDLLTKDTDGTEKSAGNLDWSAEVEAMVIVDEALTDTAHDMDSVFEMHLKKQIVEVIIKNRESGPLKSYKGNAYITKFSNAAKVGEDVTYSVSLTGSGNLKPYTPPAQEAQASYQSQSSEID